MYQPRPTLRSNKFHTLHSSRRYTFSQLLAEGWICLLGLLSGILIHLIGDFFVTEIVLIICFPILLMFRGKRLFERRFLRIFVLLGVWLAGQILSDAYRRMALSNRLRGTANIVFFAVEIASFAMLMHSERRKYIFLSSYGVGLIVMARLRPVKAAIENDSWKWGYAIPTAILVILASCFFYARRRYVPVFLMFVGIAGINLLDNYRSLFLEIMITAVLAIPIIPERIGRFRILPRKRGLVHIVVVIWITLAAGWSASRLVRYATSTGLLGEAAQQKNENEERAGNLIRGGRPEFFVGLQAALDSPILGHGSWASDMKYADLMAETMHASGAGAEEMVREHQGVIPTHSHIVAAWVFAGILGTPFWIYLFWLVVRAIIVVAVDRPSLAPIYAFLLVSYSWAIFFSPFGSTSRIIEAATIVIIIDLLDRNADVSLRRSDLRTKKKRRSEWVRPSLLGSVPNR
jgi:hypothetical protein